MTTPYSQDLRDRVLQAYDQGRPTKEIAQALSVSESWARRVRQRRDRHGEITHRRIGSPGVMIVDRQQLAALVRDHPDATLAELRTLLGVQCALSTLCIALKKMGLTFKKKRSARPSRIVPISLNDALLGVRGPKPSNRADWFSSMKHGPKPT